MFAPFRLSRTAKTAACHIVAADRRILAVSLAGAASVLLSQHAFDDSSDADSARPAASTDTSRRLHGPRVAFCERNSAAADRVDVSTEVADGSESKMRAPAATSALPSPSASSPSPVAGQILTDLREVMAARGWDACVIPPDDPHLSEYVADAFERRRFATGFGGSAGTAVVTAKEGRLWTDSRYFTQAEMELDADHWSLMRQGQPGVPKLLDYLGELCASKPGFRIGIDPTVHASSFVRELVEAATKHGGIVADDLQENPVDVIWASRPPPPSSPFRVHPLQYAGLTVAEKLASVTSQMKKKGATAAVFAALDDVAYLLNLRARDVDCNPVGVSYFTLFCDKETGTTVARLYCDPAKAASEEVRAHLKEAGVTVCPYDSLPNDIAEHMEACAENKVWLDQKRCNHAVARLVPDDRLVDDVTTAARMKAVKNEAEIKGMQMAHEVDGVAMAEFMAWLEKTVLAGRKVSEVEVDRVLTAARARQDGFLEPSFPTIAGVGSNGAIIHYKACENDTMKYLGQEDPILIDSGGQYVYGTTDVTRTWHFGKPTEEFVEMYTRVLKGHIALDSTVFPEGTPGFVLDAFARQFLWKAGRNYGHGTGHGVGAALNVHEGPQSISPRYNNQEPVKNGMIVSNEPGYYVPGSYGIRHENLVLVVDAKIGDSEEGKGFLKFEKLTLIPFQTNLVNIDMMTVEELDWIDQYHEKVWKKVGARLEDGSEEKEWLRRNCEKINRSK